MPRGSDRGTPGAQRHPVCWQPVAVAAALLLAPFSASGVSRNTPPAAAGARAAATITMEIIEGAPPELSQKLMQAFVEQAKARQVIVVSREGLPHYRVRGQFAAQSERGRMAIAWVWDVYDSQNRRALHITGEEMVGPVRDPWSLDDQAVGRIALGGVEPLVAFLASAEASPRTPVVVSDDDTPEASGIFRVFRSVWPKSDDKKPAETPPKTSDAPGGRPVQRAVATDLPTDYSALPARTR